MGNLVATGYLLPLKDCNQSMCVISMVLRIEYRCPWYTLVTKDPFYWHDLTLIQAWISKNTHYNVWFEINYPFLNFNGATVEQNQAPQEETHHPTHRFRRVFLNLFLMGWRECANTMGAMKLPSSLSSPKDMMKWIHMLLHMQERSFLVSIISTSVILLSLQ